MILKIISGSIFAVCTFAFGYRLYFRQQGGADIFVVMGMAYSGIILILACI